MRYLIAVAVLLAIIACVPGTVRVEDDAAYVSVEDGVEWEVPLKNITIENVENVPTATPSASRPFAGPTPIATSTTSNHELIRMDVGEWIDGIIDTPDDVDYFVFRGVNNKRYDVFMFTRHAIAGRIASNVHRVFDLQPSRHDCHWIRDYSDWSRGNCEIRKADSPAATISIGGRDKNIYLAVAGIQGVYAIRVMEYERSPTSDK